MKWKLIIDGRGKMMEVRFTDTGFIRTLAAVEKFLDADTNEIEGASADLYYLQDCIASWRWSANVHPGWELTGIYNLDTYRIERRLS